MTNNKYQDALNRLEDHLLTPIIPGELVEWLSVLSESAQGVGALLWRHLEMVREIEYPEIVEEDPELLPRVEHLKQADSECLKQLELLLDRIGVLKRSAGRCEPDEAALANPLKTVTDQALAWVLQAKRQEKARETWLLQAFLRDRGVVD